MSKKKFTNTFNSIIAISLMGIFAIGCAKDLPEKKSDDIKDNVFSKDLFNQTVKIKTVDNEVEIKGLTADEETRTLLAISEKKKRPVEFIDGPAALKIFFNNFSISSNGPGEVFNVTFKLTNKFIVAYVNAENRDLGATETQLVREGKLPIFQYPIESFGTIGRKKNDQEEDTHVVEYKTKSKSESSHLRTSPLPENRTESGIKSLEIESTKRLFIKNRLANKIFRASQIQKMFPNTTVFSKIAITDEVLFQAKVIKDEVIFTTPLEKKDLNPEAIAHLESNASPYVYPCSKRIATQAGMEKEECVMTSAFMSKAKHIKLQLNEDKKETIATAKMEDELNYRVSRFVNIDSEVLEYHTPGMGLKFGFEDSSAQNILTDLEGLAKSSNVLGMIERSDIENRIIKVSELRKIITSKAMFKLQGLKDSDLVKLVITGNELFVLKIKSKAELNDQEKTAMETKSDKRASACTKEEADKFGVPASKCVLAPVMIVPMMSRKLSVSQGVNDDFAQVGYQDAGTYLNADYILLSSDFFPRPFEIGKDFTTENELILSKDESFNLKKDALHLYVPMTSGSPRGATVADPFFQGKEKIVRLKFTEEGLSAFEVEKDSRFTNNDLNNSPVFTIPGRHIDYKCKRDDFDECTSTEEEDKSKHWSKRRFFSPDLKDINLHEVNPLDLWNVAGNSCATEDASPAVKQSTHIRKNDIFIEIRRTYRKNLANFNCIYGDYLSDYEDYTGLSNSSFNVDFSFSLVKLDKLASKNYEPVVYPVTDQNTFGFFKNKVSKLNGIFDPSRKDEYHLMHRWNPKNKVIDYYLSDTFHEKGQEVIKKATYDAVASINKSLNKAKTGIQINLKEMPRGMAPSTGDLKYNVIQLITDPLANGLLGYAPSVANPLTGEIVKGHINMYSGVLKTMTRRVWKRMEDLVAKEIKKNKKEKTLEFTPKMAKDVTEKDIKMASLTILNNLESVNETIIDNADHAHETSSNHSDHSHHEHDEDTPLMITQSTEKAQAIKKIKDKANKIENTRDRWARNNAYSVHAFPINGTVKKLFKEIAEDERFFEESGHLVDFDTFSVELKEEVAQIIIRHTYTTTFIHEFGHNLGLRHNFQGSFDADNFYTKEEVATMGLSNGPAYSSIMDYGYSELNELPVFGKYDIAALKFGYAREVDQVIKNEETGEETVVSIPVQGSIAEMRESDDGIQLKDYMFCTDGNVSSSITCNRFDEGVSLEQITKHFIESYEYNYNFRNFRDGRNEFKAYMDNYVIQRYREYNKFRQIFEEWEMFYGFFADVMYTGCNPEQTAQYPICTQINDRVKANDTLGTFLMKIVKTPDLSCAVKKLEPATDAEKGLKVVKMSEVYNEIKYSIKGVPSGCFDPIVKEHFATKYDNVGGFEVVAQGGKYLNGFKDTDPKFTDAADRYAKGFWADKIMAFKTLFQRSSDSWGIEESFKAIVDMPTTREDALNVINHMLLGTAIDSPLPFKTEDGKDLVVNYELFGKENKIESLYPSDDWLRYFFGLAPAGQSRVDKAYLDTAAFWGLTLDPDTVDESRDLLNYFSVRKKDILDSSAAHDFFNFTDDEIQLIATDNNVAAKKMIKAISYSDAFKKYPRELMQMVHEMRTNPTYPDTLTEEELEIVTTLETSLLTQVSIWAANPGLDPENPGIFNQLIEFFGEDMAKVVVKAWKLGAEKVTALRDIKIAASEAPTDPENPIVAQFGTDTLNALWEIEIEIYEAYLGGTLDSLVEKYMDSISILPKAVKEIDLVR